MAHSQTERFIKLSNGLYEAMMTTDFSKRHRKILDLILRLSYGCGKKEALLRPSDFELVGIRKGHIQKELSYLVQSKVLLIDGERMQINPHYDQWRVSLVTCFDPEKFNELLRRNLKSRSVTKTVTVSEIEVVTEMVTEPSSGYQNSNLPVTETVTSSSSGYQNGNSIVTEIVTNSPQELLKQEPNSYQNSNSSVTEIVTDTGINPSNHNDFSAPKDILKTMKDIDDDHEQHHLHQRLSKPVQEENLTSIMNLFVAKSGKHETELGYKEKAQIQQLLTDEIPLETILEGIEVSFARYTPHYPGQKIETFSYCFKVIRNLHAEKRKWNAKKERRKPSEIRLARDQRAADSTGKWDHLVLR